MNLPRHLFIETLLDETDVPADPLCRGISFWLNMTLFSSKRLRPSLSIETMKEFLYITEPECFRHAKFAPAVCPVTAGNNTVRKSCKQKLFLKRILCYN